jgi:hypothetical protein
MKVRLPDVQPQTLALAIKTNRHFAAVLALLLVVLAAFPGSPARSLVEDIVSSSPTPIAAPTTAPAIDLPVITPSGGLSFTPSPPPAGSPAPAPPALVDPLELPPDEPLPPPPVCSTDALADVLDDLRAPLSELLGLPVPGASIRKLAAISAGCSEADPTSAVLDLALEVAAFVPPTGVPPIDLPDLPGIDIPAGPEIVELLAPLAPGIREGCSQLATVALVFVVLPPAFSLPFSQSDLIQFLGPATSLCALFDQGAS